MDMKNSNQTSVWVRANDAGGSGRPQCLNSGLARCAGSLSPGMQLWHAEVKVRLLAVCVRRTQSRAVMPAAAKTHHPSPVRKCHLRRPPPKLTKMAAPRWRCYDSGGSLFCRCVASDQASPGSHSKYLVILTPPKQRAPHRDLHPPQPISSRQHPWWRLGFWSFISGSAGVYLCFSPLIINASQPWIKAKEIRGKFDLTYVASLRRILLNALWSCRFSYNPRKSLNFFIFGPNSVFELFVKCQPTILRECFLPYDLLWIWDFAYLKLRLRLNDCVRFYKMTSKIKANA